MGLKADGYSHLENFGKMIIKPSYLFYLFSKYIFRDSGLSVEGDTAQDINNNAIMNKLVFTFLITIPLSISQSAAQDNSPGKSTVVDNIGRYAIESTAGIIAGFLGAGIGYGITTLFAYNKNDFMPGLSDASMIGLGVGYTLANPLGVTLIGRLCGHKGNYLKSLAGCTITLVPTIIILNNKDPKYGVALSLSLPTIGSIIGNEL